jgi:hypothetical protein
MSHFYAFYTDETMNSCALVHPQTAFPVSACPELAGQSNLLIETAPLRALEIYQINPSSESVESTLSLLGSGRRQLIAEKATLPPHGARKTVWTSDVFADEERVNIGFDGVPGPNAKPLVFQIFKDGAFTACHS